MAVKKTIIIDTQVDDSEVKNLKSSLKDVDTQAQKTSKSVEDVAGNGGAIAILDQLTGGLATRFKDAFEASKLFNISLKGTKTALLATGIGAFVVILGTVVAYWSDIKDFITGSNTELAEQIEKTRILADEEQRQLDILNQQDNTLKLQGKTQKQINELKIQALKQVIEQRKEESKLAKQRLQELLEIQKAGGSTLESFARGYSNFFIRIYEQIDNLFSKLGINLGLKDKLGGASDWFLEGLFGTEEDISDAKKRINELTLEITGAQNTIDGLVLSNVEIDSSANAEETKKAEDRIKLEKDRLKALSDYEKELRLADEDLYDTTEEEKLERERERAQEKLDLLIGSEEEKREAQLALTEYYDELELQLQIKRINEQIELDKKAKEESIKLAKKEFDEKRKLDELLSGAKVSFADKTSQLIQEIAGKDSAVGKGVAVASATISGIEGVQNAFTSASKSPITTVFPAYPAIQAGLAGAFSALQIKKILSTDATGKSGAGATPTGGGGAGVTAPAFNLVQGTGTNQIAESIGNQNRPIQAFVVSGSVTTGQELDRNIIESSTI